MGKGDECTLGDLFFLGVRLVDGSGNERGMDAGGGSLPSVILSLLPEAPPLPRLDIV